MPSPNGPLRTLPFYISDGTIAARVAAVYDSTRMNPTAADQFSRRRAKG